MGKNVDTGYAGSMIEIKLMNYGRGAGKTYTLAKWATESRQRLYVAPGQTTDYTSALRRISNNHMTEVAFDDFDLGNPDHLLTLQLVANTPSVVSVILATTHEVMQTEAAAKSREAQEKLKGKLSPGVREGLERIKTAGYGDLIIDGAIQNKQLGPIQSVKGSELRLGDYIVGKGWVVALAKDDYGHTDIKTHDLTAGVHESSSDIQLRYEQVIDIDITKRQ